MYKAVSCRVSFFAVADNVISGMGKGSVFKEVGDIELFQNIVIKTNKADYVKRLWIEFHSRLFYQFANKLIACSV